MQSVLHGLAIGIILKEAKDKYSQVPDYREKVNYLELVEDFSKTIEKGMGNESVCLSVGGGGGWIGYATDSKPILADFSRGYR